MKLFYLEKIWVNSYTIKIWCATWTVTMQQYIVYEKRFYQGFIKFNLEKRKTNTNLTTGIWRKAPIFMKFS